MTTVYHICKKRTKKKKKKDGEKKGGQSRLTLIRFQNKT